MMIDSIIHADSLDVRATARLSKLIYQEEK